MKGQICVEMKQSGDDSTLRIEEKRMEGLLQTAAYRRRRLKDESVMREKSFSKCYVNLNNVTFVTNKC